MHNMDSILVRPLGAQEAVAVTGGSPIGYWVGATCRFLWESRPPAGEASFARGKF